LPGRFPSIYQFLHQALLLFIVSFANKLAQTQKGKDNMIHENKDKHVEDEEAFKKRYKGLKSLNWLM